MNLNFDINKIKNQFSTINDLIIDFVQSHPKESAIGSSLAISGLIISNAYEKHKRKEEQQRHEEVEILQTSKIKKQDAMIQELNNSVEENICLKQIIMGLCNSSGN